MPAPLWSPPGQICKQPLFGHPPGQSHKTHYFSNSYKHISEHWLFSLSLDIHPARFTKLFIFPIVTQSSHWTPTRPDLIKSLIFPIVT